MPHVQPGGLAAMRHLRPKCLRQAPTTGRLPRPMAWIEGPSHLAALVEPDEGTEAGERMRRATLQERGRLVQGNDTPSRHSTRYCVHTARHMSARRVWLPSSVPA